MIQCCEVFLLVFLSLSPYNLAQSPDIRMPPTITQSPTAQVTYRHEQRIPLDCRATGAGMLTYEWTKNGVPMNLNEFSRLEVQRDAQTIIVKYAGREDEGFYQCIVSSAYGKALSNTSHLQLATVGVEGSKEVMTMTVPEGQPFEIRAQPHRSFPRATYSWEMATNMEDTLPRKLLTNKRIQMDEDGNLHFAYAIMDDAISGNIYKLITFNQYLDQKLGGSYTRVFVEPAKDGVKNFAPIAKFSATTAHVGVVGRNISLRCFFGARPEATYTWQTPESSKRFHEFMNEKTELFIKDIRPEDQGDYTCIATNTEGRGELRLQLEVQAAPEFKKPTDRPQNINATEGDQVTFRCYAEGKPAVTTVWYRNGEILNNNNIPRRMRFSNNNQNLIIDNVCRDCVNEERATDLMVIQCNASNKHGYTLGTGYLNVLKKTLVTSISESDTVEVRKDEARTVVFKCQATSDPSTPVSIQWRRVDPQEQNNDYIVYPDNKVIFIDQGQIKFVVEQNQTDKWLELMGRYRCKANNSYSGDFKTMTLKVEDIPITAKTGGIGDLWWIFLIIALLLLLLILLLCCCIYCQRNRGDSYPVDEKERMNGNDPEKEMKDHGFQDYQRPEGQPLRGSGGSLSSSTKLNSDDEGSLNEYGDVDPGKFTEDGSFVGVYTNTADRRRGRTSEA